MPIALGAVLALAAALLAGRMLIRRPIDRLLRVAAAWQDTARRSARTGLRSPSTYHSRLG